MAAILGKILWYRRVHGITYFDQESSQETQAILKMYQNLAPSSSLDNEAAKRAWDDIIKVDDNSVIAGLELAWKKRAACKYWVEKGHAKRPEMQHLLNSLHRQLAEKNCRLYVTYVKTGENYADEISRRREEVLWKFARAQRVSDEQGRKIIKISL